MILSIRYYLMKLFVVDFMKKIQKIFLSNVTLLGCLILNQI